MEKEESWSRNFDRLSKNLKKTSIRKRNVQLTGDVAELSVLADLVWRPGADGVAVDVDVGLLPHVQPDDAAILGPLLADLGFGGEKRFYMFDRCIGCDEIRQRRDAALFEIKKLVKPT